MSTVNEEKDKRVAPTLGSLAGASMLLQLLTKRYPPLNRHNHALTLSEGKLRLNLVHVAPCESVVFDAEDLTKPLGQLILEIASLVPREPGKPVA